MATSKGTTLTLMLALALAACGPKVDPAAEEAAVREVAARYLELARAGDAAGIGGLFLPDGTWYTPGFPPGVGPAGVESAWTELNAFNPPADQDWRGERFDVAASGDLAVEHGSWGEGATAGRYVTVYRKQDGAWKILTDIGLSTAESGGAPDWARELLAVWFEAYEARDVQRLEAYYAPDAVRAGVRGRAAIAAGFRADAEWARGRSKCAGDFHGFQVVGKTALGWGRYICTGEAAVDGTTPIYRGLWASVYEQQADGSWLCTREDSAQLGT